MLFPLLSCLQVRDLWILCFGDELPREKLDTGRIRKALQHSFSIQAMFLDDEQPGSSSSPSSDAGNVADENKRKLIGFARRGRAMSCTGSNHRRLLSCPPHPLNVAIDSNKRCGFPLRCIIMG